ncbi:hypothetical protein KJ966_16240 [bacterium]|nr:hypothetical protein [bacterium]
MVKSAIELAMEKVAKMPKIDSQEIEEHKKQEFMAVGEGLANQLLKGTLRRKNLQAELGKYDENKRKLVINSLLQVLKKTVNFEDPSVNQLVFEIIAEIEPKTNIEKINEELSLLIDDYQQQKQLDYALLVKEERNRLKEMGISGSAITPNIHETEIWKNKLGEILSSYQEKLEVIYNMFPQS